MLYLITILVSLFASIAAAQQFDIHPVSYPLAGMGWGNVERFDDTHFLVANGFGLRVVEYDEADRNTPPHELFSWATPGKAQDLEIRGDICYVADGYTGLRIYRFDLDGRVTELGLCEEVVSACQLIIRDTLIYVAQNKVGFSIVNITNPANPILLGRHEWEYVDGGDIFLKDNYLFYHNGSNLLMVYDVSDPNRIVEADRIDGPAGDDDDLFDHIGDGHHVRGVEFNGDVMYITAGGRLYTVNAADPLNMRLLGDTRLGYREGDLQRFGDLMLGFGDQQNYLIDISNPNNAVSVTSEPSYACLQPRDADATPTLRQVYGLRYGDVILDISNPERPTEIHHVYNYGSIRDVVYKDGYLYVADNYGAPYYTRAGQLRVIDVHDPLNARQVAVYDTMIACESIVLQDSLLLISINEDPGNYWDPPVNCESFAIFSISDPARPRLLGGVRNLWGHIEMFNDSLVLLSRGGLQGANIRNPRQPNWFLTYSVDNEYHEEGLSISDSIVVTSVYNNGGVISCQVLNFDGRQFRELGRCNLDDRAQGSVAIYGDYVYVGDRTGRALPIAIVDISNLNAPRQVGRIAGLGAVNDLITRDHWLIVSDGSRGVKIYDLTNPDRPELASAFETPYSATRVDVDMERGFLFVADQVDLGIYDCGALLGVWNLTLSGESHDFGIVSLDSTARWELAITNHSGRDLTIDSVLVEGVGFQCDLEDVVEIGSGQEVNALVDFTPDTSRSFEGRLKVYSFGRILQAELTGAGSPMGVGEEWRAPQDFTISNPFPNPFNSNMTLRIGLPVPEKVRLAIYDITGREVSKLADARMTSGYHQLNWDGADKDGVFLPAGLYFVRFSAGDHISVKKVALIR